MCGRDALSLRVVEELRRGGSEVVVIDGPAEVTEQSTGRADAIVCASESDALNLEIALLTRELDAKIRVVSRLANSVLREAVAKGNGPGAVLDVADLAAPSVVEALLNRTTHVINVAGVEFIVSGETSRKSGTLREIYGDLAPIGVVHGESSETPGDVVACPGRDFRVNEGDWVSMIGTREELAAHGMQVAREGRRLHRRSTPWTRLVSGVRAFRDDVNPMFFRALAVAGALLAGSTTLIRFCYNKPGMSWIDALYFSSETIATVGYGDFSFEHQATWLRIFGIALMFAGVTTTAVVIAFVADILLSQRIGRNAALRGVRELHRPAIVVGLGSFGIRVVATLKAAGRDVVVVERNESNRFLATAAELDVPVIFGDSTVRQTLEDARIRDASAVAVLTSDDMVNIETGIVLRGLIGDKLHATNDRHAVPVVLRVFDRVLGSAVGHRFGFEKVHSTVDLAVPWFIGAALGLHVIATFSVGERSFMVGAVYIEPSSELDGLQMVDISTQTRIIAVSRVGQPTTLHPRRDTRLLAGDTAYLIGPYRELLATLRSGQRTG